jgi:hypothetical protein
MYHVLPTEINNVGQCLMAGHQMKIRGWEKILSSSGNLSRMVYNSTAVGKLYF